MILTFAVIKIGYYGWYLNCKAVIGVKVMIRFVASFQVLITLVSILVSYQSSIVSAIDSQAVKAQFANPPRQYSTGPLWTWNDLLTEDQIRSTLADLAGQNVNQVWVHPRPGLMTPYLGNDWFRLWKLALSEAERLDMNVWIYDENSYPSGFAGGLVPDAIPDARGQGLHFYDVDLPKVAGDEVFAVFRLSDDRIENVTTQATRGVALPKGRYLVTTKKLAPSRGWFGGKYYVDLIKPGVTEKFIEITFDAYKREVRQHFGGRVPGIFTDEPHLAPAGGLHWSDELPNEFKKRWGYDLVEQLPCLVRPVGDWKQVRHNYYQLLLELFIERWAKPCYEYCERNNLEFTGHYWEHGWPDASHGGDNMAMYAWHQRPAIDNLMNEYTEGVHGQFGNSRTVRELASVANQLGRQRTLCEAYGAGGWDLRMEDMKRIGDWLYVLGVNTLNEHLSYVTIRGARKRDHPQSFSYHAPWWESYHKMATYFTRLSLALSSGEQVHRVLLLQPTTSAWMYQQDPSSQSQLDEIGDSFQDLVNSLEKAQVEYDIGCEDIIGRHGEVVLASSVKQSTKVQLVVGKRKYDRVVLPPNTENLNETTLELLTTFVDSGGEVLCCGEPPSRVDGKVSDRGEQLASGIQWRQISAGDVVDDLRLQPSDGMTIDRDSEEFGLLFHHRRQLVDGEILFLVNTSIESFSSGTIYSKANGVEQWDLATATISPYPYSATENGVSFDFKLPPCGSLLLFLADKPTTLPGSIGETFQEVTPIAETEVRRLEPNVLTLDYVDVSAAGETKSGVYFLQAAQFAFEKNGLESNPWDRAVQFRDELITKTFPLDSGFEAIYRFEIEEQVPETLCIVIERPDLYAITCNDRSVSVHAEDWWLDKSFGKLDISRAAKVGENEVTLQASPFSIFHELESAYVLGDFSLEEVDSGLVIVPAQPLEISSNGWNEQGMPFYSAGVAYSQTVDVPNPDGKYVVALSKWYGSVAKVVVNDQVAGFIGYQPWECDVTDKIKTGENTIEVTVIGTLRNTLGPHHIGPVVGKAWPNMFHKAPESGPPAGKDYSTLSYGLFEPFVLKNAVE